MEEQGMCSNEDATVLPVYELILRDFLVARIPNVTQIISTTPTTVLPSMTETRIKL